jgi:hypothetical protein
MKHQLTPCVLAAAAAIASSGASAHVGLSNVTTPISASGQSTFAIANSTNEIVFNVPHGCTASESVPALTGPNLDTARIEVTIPAAIVTATTLASLRPTMDGLFGAVTVGAPDVNGNVKLTWTRQSAGAGAQNFTASDNHLYKISVRLKVPNVTSATDVSIKKYQFPVVQYCSSGTTEYALDWGTANSPTVLVFPDKRKGFNKFSLDATTTAADFAAASGTATLAARLKSYFGDAAIVWVGKQGYSANPNTKAKIDALAVKDTTYSELGTKAGASIAPTDTLWVKY